MTLEDIGEGGNGLFCVTDQPACCQPPFTDPMGSVAIGNWYFPNGSGVPSSGSQWDFRRVRGQMVIGLYRRIGGVDGIYRCVIPDGAGVDQIITIGVYTADTG